MKMFTSGSSARTSRPKPVTREKYPPCKRRRKLDIADVSCLVSTRQKPVFLSPEELIQQTLSPHSKPPISEKAIGKAQATVEVDVFSQELAVEDTIIQSSLPQYLDRVFGDCIGSSQSVTTDIQIPPTLNYCSTTDTPAVEDGCSGLLSVIQESQGFSVTNVMLPNVSRASGGSDSVEKNEGFANVESSPLLFQSPSSPPKVHSNNLSWGAHTYSQTPTFLSPADKMTHTRSSTCTSHNEKHTLHTVLQSSTSMPPAAGSRCSGKSTRKRRLSSPKPKLKYSCPPSCVRLMECSHMKPESIVSILALVLQVNSVMEVVCKKGSMAGHTVPVSSVLLADPTKSCVKLLLWREAACWVEKIMAGDLVYFTSIRLKHWQEEIVGHTIMYSKVLNLHQPKNHLPSKFALTMDVCLCSVLKTVPMESLQCLLEWGKSRHGYLFGDTQPIPTSQRPVHFRAGDELGVEPVVHFRAKLLAIISNRVVQLSDKPGKDFFLYLLGPAGGVWYRELSEGVGQVWELQYLAVALEGTQGNYSLQVTSRSQLRRLSMDSIDAQTILKRFPSSSQNDCISEVTSISALLQCKSSGVMKCKAKATTFNFQLLDGCVLSLHSLSGLCGQELVSQLLQAVYVGCEACAKPLTQDVNHVYCPCADCVMKTPGGCLTSAYCYRPLAVSLCDGSATLEVVANQVVVNELLGGVEATDLLRASLAQNLSQSERVREAVRRLLSSDKSDCWILNTAFTVDEFSFVESLTVSLLDCIVKS